MQRNIEQADSENRLPVNPKTPYVTIAFEDARCWPLVQDLLRQPMGSDVLLIDVNKLLQYEQLKPFDRYARHLVQHLGWRECLDMPLETLARTDGVPSRPCPKLSNTHFGQRAAGVKIGLKIATGITFQLTFIRTAMA